MADQTRLVPSEATDGPVERAQLSGMHAKSSLRLTVPDGGGEPDSMVGFAASAEIAAWGVDAVVGEAEIGRMAVGPMVCVPHPPALIARARTTTMGRRDDRMERLTKQCSRTGGRSPCTWSTARRSTRQCHRPTRPIRQRTRDADHGYYPIRRCSRSAISVSYTHLTLPTKRIV